MRISRFICILIVFLVMTLLMISESSKTVQIGYSIAKMEQEKRKLSEGNKKLVYKSDKLKTRDKIALKVVDLKLGLIVPAERPNTLVARKYPERLKRSLRERIIIAQNTANYRRSAYSVE